MKIKCGVKKLKQAILSADKITGKNSNLQSLQSILISAEKDNLNIKSTNLSLGIDVTLDADVTSMGKVAVLGGTIAGIFASLNEKEDVELELIDNTLSVSTKETNLLVKTVSYEDFPIIPKVLGSSFDIGVEKIISGMRSVFYSASVSDIKPEVSTVYIYPDEEDNVVFVATDTFRLAEKKIKGILPDFNGVLIPFKNINEIMRVLTDMEGDVTVTFNNNQISFSNNHVYLTSRLIDGVFPDYNQIIPKEFKTSVIILKQDIINGLKLATVFSDKFNQITLNISKNDSFFEISSKNDDTGENTTRLSATIEGEDILVNINHRYFLECFQSIFDDSVILQFNGSNRPIIIRGVTDKTFMYLIMPMNR